MLILLLLLSLYLVFINRKNIIVSTFYIFNFLSVATFQLQYYFELFNRFAGKSLLPGRVVVDNTKIIMYCLGLLVVHKVVNYKLIKTNFLRANIEDRQQYLKLLFSLFFIFPLYYFGEGSGYFWTTSLLLVPIIVIYQFLFIIKSNWEYFLFFILAVLILSLKSSKGVVVNFTFGLVIVEIFRKKYLSSKLYLLLPIIFSFFLLYKGIINEFGNDKSLLYILEREYTFEVFLKVYETSNYHIYFLGELLDIIPSSILSYFSIPKIGNSRILFSNFNLDYAGKIGYYIGSFTYLALIPSILGKLLYLTVLGFSIKLLSRISKKPEVAAIILFNLDFFFNGNYSYFFTQCTIPLLIFNLLSLFFKPIYSKLNIQIN
jgi:hypothetical protein